MLNENCPGGVKTPLALNRKISEDFKKISGNKDVTVYWNSEHGVYHLMLKRKFIMYMKRPINSNDVKRVKTHFQKLRSGWYRDNAKLIPRKVESQKDKDAAYTREDFRLETKELLNDTMKKQKTSVIV